MPVFSRPYHGWSFATEGKLAGGHTSKTRTFWRPPKYSAIQEKNYGQRYATWLRGNQR